MIYALVTFSSILWLVWWLLVFTMCLTLHRAIHSPALWWIGLYYAVGIVAVPVMHYYGHRIAQSGFVPEMTLSGRLTADFIHSPLALATSVATTLDYGGELLAIVLVFSEAAVLVRRVYPEAQSRVLRVFGLAHAYTRALGVATIVLTALLPVPAMVYFYTHR